MDQNIDYTLLVKHLASQRDMAMTALAMANAHLESALAEIERLNKVPMQAAE